MNLRAFCLILLGLHITTSAIADDPKSENSVHYFFVMAQGFYSCTRGDQNMAGFVESSVVHARHRLAADGIQTQVTFTVVESCFNGGLVENGGKEILKYRIIESDGSRGIYREIGPGGINELIQVRSAIESLPNRPTRVVMFGHSHGGWLVMKIASQWRGNAILSQIFTLDPISLVKCSQSQFVMEKIWRSSPIRAFTTGYECEKAPSDLEEAGHQIAANASGKWTNFYETQFPFLHSGPAVGASANLHISYPLLASGHRDLLFDERVRNSVLLKISSDMVADVQALND